VVNKMDWYEEIAASVCLGLLDEMPRTDVFPMSRLAAIQPYRSVRSVRLHSM
jgi:hypothetical protein